MLNLGYFEIAYNENNHLKITEAGKKVLFGKERAQLVVIKREESYGKKGSAKENKTASPAPLFTPTVFENEDEGLFEALRQLRKSWPISWLSLPILCCPIKPCTCLP